MYIVDYTGKVYLIKEDLNGTIYLQNLFPDYTFKQPVGITKINNQEDTFLIIEREGVIKKVNIKTKNITVLTNLSEKVNSKDWEQGLLGITVNAERKDDTEIFITYNSIEDGSLRLSRLYLSNVSYEEEIILTIEKESARHNAGHICFGPDNFLYMGIGDDYNPENSQNKKNLKGSIIRINIMETDIGKSYSIPKDNPYYDNNNVMPEIYSLGFRNPWKFSFDKLNGDMWVGDVGHNDWEEINIVESGLNYGWPRYEGQQCYAEASQCIDSGLELMYVTFIFSVSFSCLYFGGSYLIPLKSANFQIGITLVAIGLGLFLVWYHQSYIVGSWRHIDMTLVITTYLGYLMGIILALGITNEHFRYPLTKN